MVFWFYDLDRQLVGFFWLFFHFWFFRNVFHNCRETKHLLILTMCACIVLQK